MPLIMDKVEIVVTVKELEDIVKKYFLNDNIIVEKINIRYKEEYDPNDWQDRYGSETILDKLEISGKKC